MQKIHLLLNTIKDYTIAEKVAIFNFDDCKQHKFVQ